MEAEFRVKLAPKMAGKKLSLFKTHKNDDVKWEDAKMKRENDMQPWKIKTGSGQASRRYKANRIGGFNDSSEYFVFARRGDTFEVSHVDESYNVVADKRYKTLTDEQAEEAFAKREKIFNQAGLMIKRDNEEPSRESRSFKISEMDDWDGPDDFSASEGEEGDTGAKKKVRKKTIKDEESVPEEGKEDSDEGDFEQREVDYISESSSSESELDEEDADPGMVKELDDLLASDEEDEDGANGAPKPNLNDNPPEIKPDPDGNGSDDSDEDGDDDDIDEEALDSMFMRKSLPAALVKEATQASSSQPNSTTASKRKLEEDPVPGTSTTASVPTIAPVPPPPKRPCPPAPNSIEKTIEDLIKKYLTRKPTTLKTLLKDIKAKLRRMGITDFELKDRLTSIAGFINNLNPEKERMNGETYLFLKS